MRRLSIGALLGILAGVLVALALAIGILNGALGLRITERRAEQAAQQLAQTAASSLESYLDDAVASLAYLASRGLPVDESREACRERMAHLGNVMSEFFQVATFDADGTLVCASTPIPAEMAPTLADEPWFDALRGGDTLVVGPPTRVEEIDAWVSPLAYPVRADDGSFRGAVLGTADLDRFQRLLSAVQLPGNGLITVTRIDDGVVVARSREAEAWVGRQIRDRNLDREQIREGGVNRAEGMDGVDRLWGFAPVADAGWVVFAGFPLRWIQGPAWRAIVGTGVLTLALLAVAVLLVIRVRTVIAGSVRELVDVSRSAARGGADRISVEGPPEIQELAAAFNRTLNDRAVLDRRLREAEKTEALARLSAGVAHDFRNLLTVITGEASLAISELEPDHPVRRNLEGIEDAASRAAEVTRKLLAFSQQDPEDVGAVDLNAQVREESHLLELTVGDRHSIRTELAPDLPPVLCGERRIDVILRELVENAVDALPDGGAVEIQTGRTDAGPPARAGDTAPARATGEGRRERPPAAYLEVRDRGEGMTPEVRKRIFEPFFTTKPRSRGTGLGMPTVHGLIQQIGGRVEVESEPGRGTRVRVHFPHGASGDGRASGGEGWDDHAPRADDDATGPQSRT